MKTTIKIAVATLVIASFGFEGCKKGPNDPFLSIHTRKARVVGDWTVKSGNGSDANGSSTTTWTYDGTTYVQTPGGSGGMTYTVSYMKDGTFKTVQTTTSTNYSDAVTETGTWDFTGKVGDDKNKDHIVMKTLVHTEVQTIMSSSTTTSSTYTGDNAPVALYYLDELKNKEMIFTWDGTTTTGSSTSSSKGTYMLMQ